MAYQPPAQPQVDTYSDPDPDMKSYFRDRNYRRSPKGKEEAHWRDINAVLNRPKTEAEKLEELASLARTSVAGFTPAPKPTIGKNMRIRQALKNIGSSSGF